MMICCLLDPETKIVVHFVDPVVANVGMVRQWSLLRIVLLRRQSKAEKKFNNKFLSIERNYNTHTTK